MGLFTGLRDRMRTFRTPHHGGRKALGLGAAAALLTAPALIAPAQAAPLPVTLSNVTQSVTETPNLSTFRIDADWTTATTPAAGDSFFIPLTFPAGGAELRIPGANFTINNGAGNPAADCVAVTETAPTGITCTFRSPLPAGTGNTGDIWFNAFVIDGTVGEDVEFGFGGEFIHFAIVQGQGSGEVPQVLNKNGGTSSDTRIAWNITIPAEKADLFAQSAAGATIVDSFRNGPGTNWFGASVIYLPQTYDRSSLKVRCINTDITDFTVQWAPDGQSFTLVIPPAVFQACKLDPMYGQGGQPPIWIDYSSDLLGPVVVNPAGAPQPWFAYGNDVTVNGEVVKGYVQKTAQGGGGVDTGLSVVNISKEIEGEAADLITTEPFTVQALVQGESAPRTIQVVPGTPSSIGSIPVNTPITLSELNLPEIEGVEWGEYTFELNGTPLTEATDGSFTFTPTASGLIELSLVNVADEEEEEPTSPEPTSPEPTDPEPTSPEPTDPSSPAGPRTPAPTDPGPTDPATTPAGGGGGAGSTGSPKATTTPAKPASGTHLASTGATVAGTTAAALTLALLGGGVVLVARRRREAGNTQA